MSWCSLQPDSFFNKRLCRLFKVNSAGNTPHLQLVLGYPTYEVSVSTDKYYGGTKLVAIFFVILYVHAEV